MQGLTPRCAELLNFIKKFSRTPGSRGLMPSHEEMKLALGLRSKSGVTRILNELQERGHIRKARGRSRAIELIPKFTHCPHCGNYLGAKTAPVVTYSSSPNTP